MKKGKKMKRKFRVVDSVGEVNYVSDKDIVTTIHDAWNYEAYVYEINQDGSSGDCIFYGWEENEILSEWLEPYGLRVIDKGSYRYLQNISDGKIHVASWQTLDQEEKDEN